MGLLTGAGRVGRLHYLLVNLACGVGLVAPLLIGSETDPATGEAPPLPIAAVLVVLLLFLLGAWISIATSIRRLHDRGHTGWLVLLTPLPFLGFALGLYLLFAPGDPLANRYGPPPGSPDPDALRAQLAQLEAVTAKYRQPTDPTSGPSPSAWPEDTAFDAGALYRDNPGLGPSPAFDGPPPVHDAPR